MKFYEIATGAGKKGELEVYPEFSVTPPKDLMVRGKAFYAVWDEETKLWSTDEYLVQKLVDDDIRAKVEELEGHNMEGTKIVPKYMSKFGSGSWAKYQRYLKSLPDSNHQLDNKIIFKNTKTKLTDYASKKLDYALEPGDYSAWDEIVGTLYEPEERSKLEWAIGAIVSGDSKDIQKFMVLYGKPGSGKSTILNIIQMLFDKYYTTFDAKALTSSSNAFSTEAFKTNPLVAIQHDGDLSKIEDNTLLNSIVSHEMIRMNEKYMPSYMAKANCFLFIATNKPVKITDAMSGVIRRLISVNPSNRKIPSKRYSALMSQVQFELGAIAYHCLEVYRSMGKLWYDNYQPTDMRYKTDPFYNFVEYNYDLFNYLEDGITVKAAYAEWEKYKSATGVEMKLPQYKFREELKNYFKEFYDVTRVDGQQVRSYYRGFLADKFQTHNEPVKETPLTLVLDQEESILDKEWAEYPAQYAGTKETPTSAWIRVKTKLKDLDTKKIHYVKPPEDQIVIDFDLKNKKGEKDAALNLEAAAKWPQTYAEYSKGGSGIHLHYRYTGDVKELAPLYSEGIEVKVFTGGSSLRRRLTKCNGLPIAEISSGLPLREKKVISPTALKNEKDLINKICKALRKEVHPATKPNIDFIDHLLNEAYDSGMSYDVTSTLYKPILNFAYNSTNNKDYCVKKVKSMKFRSADREKEAEPNHEGKYKDNRLVFFDVEVFPNLFLVNWKFEGTSDCVRMINPSSDDIEDLVKYKLVGFNCRRYDNHILYGRMLGYSNMQLYNLSRSIIAGNRDAMFREAYNLSYTDVYDFCSVKQSLKKWEIETGYFHKELGMDWDKPVPEERWEEVAAYCDNDVMATEVLFKHRQADWTAREILADVAGLSVNDTTNSLTTRIIFEKDPKPQSEFNYRNMGDMKDLKKVWKDGAMYKSADPELETAGDNWTFFDSKGRPLFYGYSFDRGKSFYRGEETGEGGYVYSEPGIHRNVALLDIASMHPSSIVAENLFGDRYTKRFQEILQARIAIKHKDFKTAKKLLDGKLSGYLKEESTAKDLAQALKIAINSVYGLTSAKFDNPFRDPRNLDNIVAKRGALFMINLKHEVQKRGFQVAHIKTDSIKIPNATPEIIQFVMEYGKLYGYNFEHEATYDRMCLVNDAVYIARYSMDSKINGDHCGKWTATGTQFQIPYVFKTLFSKEPIEFGDLCETKSVSTALYIDYNEGLPSDQHNYHFIGKVGLFCPVKPGTGGGVLLRESNGKYSAATGSKGYLWQEAEIVKLAGNTDDIDLRYYNTLAAEARDAISKYGDFEEFASEDEMPPW